MRNAIFHRAEMNLTDTELQDTLNTLIEVLEDSASLLHDRDACLAVRDLESLRQNERTVTTEEEYEILRQRKEALNEIEQRTNEGVLLIEEATSEALQSIKANRIKALDEVSTSRNETIKKVTESGSEILEEVSSRKKQMTDEIYALTNVAMQKVNETKSEALHAIADRKNKACNEENGTAVIDINKQMSDREVFRKKLALHLRKNYTTTSLSPLKRKENDVSIDDVYTEANMKLAVKSSEDNEGHTTVPLESFCDIFQIEAKSVKRIYLLGEVGTGKTAYCQMLISQWCKFILSDHQEDTEVSKLMKKYQFVFYLLLRKLQDNGNLKEMIKWYHKNEVPENMVEEILSDLPEECLILADGLDEWKPSPDKQNERRPDHVTEGIPDSEDMKDVTLITTSRPSGHGVLNMRSSEYDKKIILYGIKSGLVEKMAKKYCSKIKAADKDVLMRLNVLDVKDIENIPLVLKHIVWMLGNGYEISPGISGLYSDIVKIAMKWAYDTCEQEIINFKLCRSFLRLPEEFNGTRFPFIEKCQNLIFAMSQVAFEMLSMDSNRTLGRFRLIKYGIDNDQIKTLLAVGLLSEDSVENPAEEDSKFSFTHTSFLEYFSAIFIARQGQSPTSNEGDENSPDSVNLLNSLFEKCRSVNDVIPLSMVLKFVCGLSPDLTQCVCENIYRIAQSCKTLSRERELLVDTFLALHGKLFHSFMDVQRLTDVRNWISHCFQENKAFEKLLIPMLDLFVDDKFYRVSINLMATLLKMFSMTKYFLFICIVLKIISGIAPEWWELASQHISKISLPLLEKQALTEYIFPFYDNRFQEFLVVQRFVSDCVKECKRSNKSVTLQIPILDVVMHDNSFLNLREHVIKESVQYLFVFETTIYEFEHREHSGFSVDCSKFKHLKTIEYRYRHYDEVSHKEASEEQCVFKNLKASVLENLFMSGRIIPDILTGDPCGSLQNLTISEISLRSHNEMTGILNFISNATTLRVINMSRFECWECDPRCHHIMDLSKHDKLQTLYLFCTPKIHTERINKSDLENLSVEHCCFDLVRDLRNSQKLETLIIQTFALFSNRATPYPAFTRELNNDICTFTKLKHLWLVEVDIQEDALQLHSRMENLSRILLLAVSISESTFIKFVESLLTLKQSVSLAVWVNDERVSELCKAYIRTNQKKFRSDNEIASLLLFETVK